MSISYLEAGLRAFRKYFLLYDRAHLDVQTSHLQILLILITNTDISHTQCILVPPQHSQCSRSSELLTDDQIPLPVMSLRNTTCGMSIVLHSFIHSFIPVACAECDNSLLFSGASSIPLCYVLFPAMELLKL